MEDWEIPSLFFWFRFFLPHYVSIFTKSNNTIMNRQEILDAMAHNAKAMIAMGTETGDMDMALVGHATLTAMVAVQRGEGREFAIAMMAFQEIMHDQEREKYANAKMPEQVEEMFKSLGISLSQD